MKLSLYLDEDSQDTALVRALRSRGIEVMTATEAGMLHRDDEEQLAWPLIQGVCSTLATLGISICFTDSF